MRAGLTRDSLRCVHAAFIESNPIPVKAMLHMQGRMQNVLRLPLVPLSDVHHDTVRRALADAKPSDMAFTVSDLEAAQRSGHPRQRDTVSNRCTARVRSCHRAARARRDSRRAARTPMAPGTPWPGSSAPSFSVSGWARVVEMSTSAHFTFFDKHTFPARDFRLDIRCASCRGSTVRRGAYLAPSVVCMPPMFVNAGAYVGRGTMIDSHALVGSCAQIGEGVHLSAAAQVGGVARTESNASPSSLRTMWSSVGIAACTKARGAHARGARRGCDPHARHACVRPREGKRCIAPRPDKPLEIPEGAVVVPGARRVSSAFGERKGCRCTRRSS
jgi:2,3,4,5-tetrahydropyridine-2-carboxylate N-succinyltransferase